MFDVLIREAATRFGLGDKALPVLQMLLAHVTNKDTGGLAGFLEKFMAAGLGPVIQSWLGGGPAAQPIGNSQLEAVLGHSGGLLAQITARLDAGRDNVTSALGYLLPTVVGKLTPGGSIPTSLPAEVVGLAAEGQRLLAAPAASTDATAGATTGGALTKWLPWVIVVLAVLFGLSYWGTNRTEPAPAGAASVTAPAQSPAAPAASEPAAAASDAASAPPATPMPAASAASAS